jgi:lysophospholipid acyltransferase (LPLAT)-like uncharacterized protein
MGAGNRDDARSPTGLNLGITSDVTKPARSRSSRKLTRGRLLLYRLAVGLASLVLEVLWHTCRIRYVGLDAFRKLVQDHGAVVPVCWHQHLLICARFLVSKKVCPPMKPGFMISPSVDGEAPTMLARSYGAHVVRGSGTYSGLRAVRGAKQAIERDGISAAVTPDGPKGPRFKFKPGAIFAAQSCGKPVIPVAFAAKPAWVLKTWDKFVIPVPFGRICIAMGEPFYPPAEMNGEQMQEAQREMERRMLATYRLAAAELQMKTGTQRSTKEHKK